MKNKYNIGDKVYHISPDSPQGTVLDVIYYMRADKCNYLITWGHDYNSTVWEEELSYDKNNDINSKAGF